MTGSELIQTISDFEQTKLTGIRLFNKQNEREQVKILMNIAKIIFLIAVFSSSSTIAFAQTAEKNDGKDSATLENFKSYLVALSVPDVAAATDWYRQKLGFTVVKRMNLPEYSLRINFLELNDFRIELIENKKSFSIKKYILDYKEASALLSGVSKFAFLVADVESVATDLKKRGVRFEINVSEDKGFNVKFFIISDNNGNLIQFFQKLD